MAAVHTAAQNGSGGAPFRVRWDGTINLGTLVQMLALVATLTAAYFGVQARLDSMERQTGAILQQIGELEVKADQSARRNQRMELYLQTRDKQYWEAVRRFEQAMPEPPQTRVPAERPPEWRRPQ